MKKYKSNLPLGIGLILFSITQISIRLVGMPKGLSYALLILAVAFELWGVVWMVRSPEMKNSPIRLWKLRLIGRAEK